ncbi:uncharacterized protein LOC113367439 [Ctenocephalides felis]|uniref:uncharacterized protein LOC113367439 n=1 Tax=Ctenocephalides felis TaxID=7515 RepID=UPI000E6E415A|nr:uncharacterized protein LOC113367439 [Ctenocephalides felis]
MSPIAAVLLLFCAYANGVDVTTSPGSNEFSSSEEIGRAGGSTRRPNHHKKHRHRTTTITPAAFTTTIRTTTRRPGTLADTGFSSLTPTRNTTPPPQSLPNITRDKPFRDPLPGTSVQPIRPDNGPITGVPITAGAPFTGSTVGLTGGYPQSVTPSIPFDDAINYTGRDELYHDRRERPARPVDSLDPEKKRSEADLPECRARAVCNKVDLYDSGAPWVERQCRCVAPDGGEAPCPSTANAEDGHTLVDKTRHYKLCEPIKRLPKCRYFRDTTWTLTTLPEANATEQVVHCHCPRNAVTYLIKRQAYKTANGQTSYQYSFACSPQSRLRCQRKEPCRLFTVRKRQEFLEEVNSSTLCQCPRDHHCPRHHTDPGSISGKSYTEESIRTYSGYCMPS